MANIVRVDLKPELFTYDIDLAAQARAQAMDGKLLLVTNVADIERGFHVLKSEIETAPVFRRSPDRIRAHASICFMAFVLHQVMRQRLKLADRALLPQAAQRQLRRLQRQRGRIDGGEPIAGISTIHQGQADTLDALKIQKPSLNAQMSLL